jgi:hypothetical protein
LVAVRHVARIGSFAGSKTGKAVGTGLKQGAKKVWNSLFG